ncbi:HtaA domain-containing protein [Herbiconiux sp. P18]|uniref:HtaA domain-containing protein n=1 Tax=Herbiconiux liangxiaofengii TaxID=3342795 RepID=UPI0035B70C4F
MTRSRSRIRPASHPRHRAFGLAAVVLAGLVGGAGYSDAGGSSAAASEAGLATPDVAAAEITEGSLTWGFKESFRRYIGGAAAITVTGGAMIDAAGVGTFPLTSGAFEEETGTTELGFAGSVRYRSHCEAGLGLPVGECALDSTYSQFRLVIGPTGPSLYAHVVARQVGDGYPMNDFGELRIAALTVTADRFASADGISRWTDVPTAAAAEGTPATAYGAGTPLDPISVSYTGPGGPPVTGETWTAPGTPLLGSTARWASSVPQNQPSSVFSDGESTVIAVNQRTSFDPAAPALTAFDAAELEQVGASTDLPATDWEGTGAFDPATDTAFLSSANPDGTLTVIAAGWDASAREFRHVTVDDHVTLLAGFTVDPTEGRLVAITLSDDYTTPYLTTWMRTDGAWQRTDSALPVVDDRAEPVSCYSPAGPSSLAALSDGTLILARSLVSTVDYDVLDGNPAPLSITVADGAVSASETDGAVTSSGPDALSGEAANVFAGPDGSFALTSNGAGWADSFVRFGHSAGGAATVEASPIVLPTAAEEPVVVSFEPGGDGGTVWAKAVTSGTVVAIRDGAVLAGLVDQDTARSYTLAALPDGAVVTGGRNAEQHSTLTRIGMAGVSPTITRQPVAAVAGLGETVTFSAEATGTPAPTVQWQQSSDGAAFTDVPGATSTELSIVVGTTDIGQRYRAVFSNPAGAIATSAAPIALATPPTIVVPPTSVTAAEGSDATFEVMSTGNPEPTVTWEQKTHEGWAAMDVANAVVGEGTLTLTAVTREQNGLTLRAVVRSTAGEIVSEEATLTVTWVAVPGGPSPTPAPDPGPGGSGAADTTAAGRGALAATGLDLAHPLIITALLLLGGSGTLYGARRRNAQDWMRADR